MTTFLRGWLVWSRLRTIGNSAIARATVLVPIVGWLILFNDYVVNAFTKSPFGSHVSLRLVSLYVGLFLFSIGALIYAVRCPEVTKRYATAAEYSSAEFNHLSIAERNEIIAHLENDKEMAGPLHALRTNVGLQDEEARAQALAHINAGKIDPSTFGGVNNYVNGVLELKFRSDNQELPALARCRRLVLFLRRNRTRIARSVGLRECSPDSRSRDVAIVTDSRWAPERGRTR